MSNHIKLGPVIVRIGSKHLAPWGFPRIRIGGLSLWSWTNTGEFMPASYHPASSITWLWGLYIGRASRWGFSFRRDVWHCNGNTTSVIGPLIFRFHWQERMDRKETAQ